MTSHKEGLKAAGSTCQVLECRFQAATPRALSGSHCRAGFSIAPLLTWLEPWAWGSQRPNPAPRPGRGRGGELLWQKSHTQPLGECCLVLWTHSPEISQHSRSSSHLCKEGQGERGEHTEVKQKQDKCPPLARLRKLRPPLRGLLPPAPAGVPGAVLSCL